MNRHSMKPSQKSVNINASKLFNRTPNGSVGKPRVFNKQVTHANLNRVSHAFKAFREAQRKYTRVQINHDNLQYNVVMGLRGRTELFTSDARYNKALKNFMKAKKIYHEVAKRVLYPKQIKTLQNHLTATERNNIKKMAQKLVAKRSKLPNNVINKIFG